MVDTCFIRVDGWSDWWISIQQSSYLLYLSLIVAMLGILISFPIVRLSFYFLRHFTSKEWEWTADVEELLTTPSGWLIRIGLFWTALTIVELTQFLCFWPLWAFGVPLLYWINAFGEFVTRFVVRHGLKHSDRNGRKTLLQEGTTIIKITILIVVFYSIYIAIFGLLSRGGVAVLIIGLCFAVALSCTTLVYNMCGSFYALFGSMMTPGATIVVPGTPHGMMTSGTIACIGLHARDGTQTYIPGGQLLRQPLASVQPGHWPLRLTFRLPDDTKSDKVRMFVQDLEYLMHQVHQSSTMFSEDSLKSTTPLAKSLSVFERKQDQHRYHPESAVFVAVEGKWIVRVQSHTLVTNLDHHRQIVSHVCRAILNLLEKSELSHHMLQ